MLAILGLIGIALVNDALNYNQKYYGTERDRFRNNPQVQKQRKGTDRLMEDLQRGVSPEERYRRRTLGYYDGEDVVI